ncbi:hypothetical protein B4W72_08425 [Staphylococcus delphini]|uniref:Uncharacterized protein n=1 Tax=Staphylococcus delphini TaxID=53344 RepID=A0A2A4GXN2_9STAP|nr:hypothetical protein B5C08_06465 [Staphylococcus delphini]PCF60865.1 hypothetical protein B5C01_09470 [Staphylococcus delphini]PCF72304.1 hypothetical protein B4W72_08425 [Staphylococcus delphini]
MVGVANGLKQRLYHQMLKPPNAQNHQPMYHQMLKITQYSNPPNVQTPVTSTIKNAPDVR